MLPGQSLPVPMPREWRELLGELAPVFAWRPTFRLFTALACGMILADRCTVVAMAAAAGTGRDRRRAREVLRRGEMGPGRAGPGRGRLVVEYLLGDGDPIVIAADGTFFRRWGRHVAETRWAYDGAAQGGKKIAFGNYADPPVMPTGSLEPAHRLAFRAKLSA
jgi:hypothetical protein